MNQLLRHPSFDKIHEKTTEFNQNKDLLHSVLSSTHVSVDTPNEGASLENPMYTCPIFIFPTLVALLFSTPPSTPVVSSIDPPAMMDNSDIAATSSSSQVENNNFKCEFCNKVNWL